MFDVLIRRRLDPLLDRFARRLVRLGVEADTITLGAFAVGVAGAGAIMAGQFWAALVLILVSRLGDGLDGAVARASPARDGRFGTDLGGYLDIVLDFGFYALVPLAFVLHDPAENGVPGAVLLAAFYFNGASFLAFAALEARRTADGRTASGTGPKAIRYTIGLMEGAETIVFFCVLCLVPYWFAPLAYAFAALTLLTTLARLALAWRTFGRGERMK